MQGVILAAGKGTRLGALTARRSKAMLPVLGRPLVRRVLDSLASLPVEEWLIVASPEDQEIISYFNSERLDAPVRLVFQPEPWGMADALSCAAPLIEGDFALSACDNLAPQEDIQRMLARWLMFPRPQALLALLRIPPKELSHSSAVILEGSRVIRVVEKPLPGEAPGDLAGLPLYLFTTALLDHLPEVRPSSRGEYELQDAINRLIAGGGEVEGIRFSARQALTSPADLLALNRRLLAAGKEAGSKYPAGLGAGTRLVNPVYIETGAHIGSNCVIGPEVYLERGCLVEDGVRLERSVILRDGKIPAGRVVIDQVVAAEFFAPNNRSTG